MVGCTECVNATLAAARSCLGQTCTLCFTKFILVPLVTIHQILQTLGCSFLQGLKKLDHRQARKETVVAESKNSNSNKIAIVPCANENCLSLYPCNLSHFRTLVPCLVVVYQ